MNLKNLSSMKKLCFLIILLIFLFPDIAIFCQEKTEEPPPPEDIQIKVLLAAKKEPCRIASPGGLIIVSGDERKTIDAPAELILTVNGEEILVQNGDQQISLRGSVSIEALKEDEPVRVQGRKYRGKIRLCTKKSLLYVVNELLLEEYLYGVVPEELYSSQIEATKAQAVMARTFAIAHLGKFSSQGYDVPSTDAFQVYGGMDVEKPLCNRAVQETRRKVITYQGKLAKNTVYHSTCGGRTEANEVVFLTPPIPYLRSVPCSLTPTENKDDGTPKEKTLSAAAPDCQKTPDVTPQNGSAKPLCENSPIFHWKVTWKDGDLEKIIQGRLGQGKPLGKIKEIIAAERGKSGRVTVLEIRGEGGDYTFYGDEIRGILRFVNEKGGTQNLYSDLFTLKSTAENGEKVWTAEGSGWGHGVGMCQFGAIGLAKKGYNYIQILKHYFTGVEIQDLEAIKK